MNLFIAAHVVSTLCVGLFSGLMMTLVVLMQQQWAKLRREEYVPYFKGFLTIAKGNPIISLITLGSFIIPVAMGVVALMRNAILPGILLLSAGLVFFLGCFLVTMKLNFPIYNKVIGWTESDDAADWEDVRARFFTLNLIRMSSAITSFALLAIVGIAL